MSGALSQAQVSFPQTVGLGNYSQALCILSLLGGEALHPLFLTLTTVVQGKFITPIVALKLPEAQGGSDLPKVTQPVRVELGFQAGLVLLASPLCVLHISVSQAGKNCGASWRNILNLLSHSSSEQMRSFLPWYTFPSSRNSQILLP